MAKVILIHDGVNLRDYRLDKPVTKLGRQEGNDIQLDDAAISSCHAQFTREESDYLENHFDYYIEDLKSTNGTTVNGVGITKHLLKQGDEIKVGKHKFTYDAEQGGNLDQTAIYIPEN